MKIGGVDTAETTALVAEVGHNHEGSVALAEELIATAVDCGADAVKLQTCIPEQFVSVMQPQRLEMLQRFSLPLDEVVRIVEKFHGLGIHVFTTPLDLVSAHVLAPHLQTIKVSSGDLTFSPLLEFVAASGRDVIISTGASDLLEVEQAVALIEAHRTPSTRSELGILHCVASYPASPASLNLGAMASLRERFPHAVIGYSDHAMGIEASVLAVAAGARIVEKHFTLDNHFSSFRDHALSADPLAFRELRNRMDDALTMLGDGVKRPHSTEQEARVSLRRSIVAARDIDAGRVLSPQDLIFTRPADGVSPSRFSEVVGATANRPFLKGEPITDGGISLK